LAALTRDEFFAAGPIRQLELVCSRLDQLGDLVTERETEIERPAAATATTLVGRATLEGFALASRNIETACQEMHAAISHCYAAWQEQEAQQKQRPELREATWEIITVCDNCNGEGTVEHQVEADVFRSRDCEHCDRGEVTVTEMAYEDEAEVRADYPNAISVRRAV
jgi:hypothetical protein|tara:strand:+ start:534 stop:1034 length:501 start_codon:yes stop_codon:yes gene_type:complete